MDLYEKTYKKKRHFSFGKNWQEYIKTLSREKIEEAKKSILELIGEVKGKTFLDIGCGSGLFSLAAYKLGAEVTSVDIDDYSILCAKKLKKKFKCANWKIKKGSALDKKFLDSLGQYDIVYSWGVLHHTGKMRQAIKNTSSAVKKNGLLCIAIYNDNPHVLEGPSWLWAHIKKAYNKSPEIIKKTMYISYLSYLFAGLTAHGINPYNYIRNYKTNRGMNFFTDVKDWLGGYPYEYAKSSEIKKLVEMIGFKQVKLKEARSLGCNEFLFRRKT